MKHFRRLRKIAVCMAAVSALGACGGGGGGGSASTATTPAPSLAGPVGKAVQGPVKGATVFADSLAGGSRMVGQKPLVSSKVGRNEPCPCGSGSKYKKCCGK